ncbi:FIG01269488: protein, clustered with ribosomal protein L32p [hydrothermal vent metagenome]|uniref:Large ribosomal RNA subunit accumulation protein YceD n=1 Tax=hydrothermal vent metagenome TaxID=652676 RepID=A0A3B0W7M6_9ZZZZ
MQTQLSVMQLNILPELLNFPRQVELNRVIEGTYPVSKLARLNEALLSNNGDITAKLVFTDSVGFASLKGEVSAKLLVQCQRCLEAVETELSGSFKFALISNEDEIGLLPEEFEPYLIEGEEQSIAELIEDELLLCLPMVTVHENDCSAYMAKQNKAIKAEMEKAKKVQKEAEHPFAGLKALKENLNDKVN